MRIPLYGKVIIGILTIGQLFIGLGFFIWFLAEFIPTLTSGDEDMIKAIFLESFKGVLLWLIFLSFLSTAILIFYIIHAGIHKKLSTTMKVIWILLFILFGGFVEVVYFFMEIVPEKSMTARLEGQQPIDYQGAS